MKKKYLNRAKITNKVLQILNYQFADVNIEITEDIRLLADLQADSLDLTEILMNLEGTFRMSFDAVSVDDEDEENGEMTKDRTVKDIIDFIEEAENKKFLRDYVLNVRD